MAKLRTRDITSEVAGWAHKSEETKELMARFYVMHDIDYELGNGILQVMKAVGNSETVWSWTSEFGTRIWYPVVSDKWGTGRKEDRDATAMLDALNWYYMNYIYDGYEKK